MTSINGLYRNVRYNDNNLWRDGYKAARQWFIDHAIQEPFTFQEQRELDVFTEQLLHDLTSRTPGGGRWLPSAYPYHKAVKRVVYWYVAEHDVYGTRIIVRCPDSDEVKNLSVVHNSASPAECLANLKAIAARRVAAWQADVDAAFPQRGSLESL